MYKDRCAVVHQRTSATRSKIKIPKYNIHDAWAVVCSRCTVQRHHSSSLVLTSVRNLAWIHAQTRARFIVMFGGDSEGKITFIIEGDDCGWTPRCKKKRSPISYRNGTSSEKSVHGIKSLTSPKIFLASVRKSPKASRASTTLMPGAELRVFLKDA